MNLTEEKGQARDTVAKKVQVSPTTYQRAKVIIERGSEKLNQLRKDEVTISHAYNKVLEDKPTRSEPMKPKFDKLKEVLERGVILSTIMEVG